MADNLPAPRGTIGRAALERVLARAAELQVQRDDDGSGLSEAQVLDLAKEVGLTADAVRQALAEEAVTAATPREAGMAFTLLGSSVVRASRTVPGTPATTLAALDGWMQRGESLQVKRRFVNQLDWEARQDLFSTMWRALRLGGRGFHLAGATEVRGVVTAADGNRTNVALAADYHDARARRAGVTITIAALGVVVGLPGFALAVNAGLTAAAALALVPALGVPVAAFAVARNAYRALLTRATVALEQALDRLEFGDARR